MVVVVDFAHVAFGGGWICCRTRDPEFLSDVVGDWWVAGIGFGLVGGCMAMV